MIKVIIEINGKPIYDVSAVRIKEMNFDRRKEADDARFKLREYKLSDGRKMRHWASEGANTLASRMIADGIEEDLIDMLEQHGDNWAISSNERTARVLGRRWSKAKQRWI